MAPDGDDATGLDLGTVALAAIAPVLVAAGADATVTTRESEGEATGLALIVAEFALAAYALDRLPQG